MNKLIINNLFELWKHIGSLNNRLIEKEAYAAVSMSDSDWPNRVFDIQDANVSIPEIMKLSKQKELPNIVTLTKPNNLNIDSDFNFVFGQKNMAFSLDQFVKNNPSSANIHKVKTEKDADDFAYTAAAAFGYRVDPKVIFKLVEKSESVRLFIYREGQKCLGCGIVFFDSNDIAGLHMIGTLPEGRGKGIGKKMTEKLLIEAKENEANICVLHASIMGEPIYLKLGFKPYGEIETYKIS